MIGKRFRIDGHMLEDSIENKFYIKDKGYIHIANILYEQMEKILEALEEWVVVIVIITGMMKSIVLKDKCIC